MRRCLCIISRIFPLLRLRRRRHRFFLLFGVLDPLSVLVGDDVSRLPLCSSQLGVVGVSIRQVNSRRSSPPVAVSLFFIFDPPRFPAITRFRSAFPDSPTTPSASPRLRGQLSVFSPPPYRFPDALTRFSATQKQGVPRDDESAFK